MTAVLCKEPESRVIFLIYKISLTELLLKKFSEFWIDFDCLSQNVSISGLSAHPKLANICSKGNNNIRNKHKFYLSSGCRSNVKFTHNRFIK